MPIQCQCSGVPWITGIENSNRNQEVMDSLQKSCHVLEKGKQDQDSMQTMPPKCFCVAKCVFWYTLTILKSIMRSPQLRNNRSVRSVTHKEFDFKHTIKSFKYIHVVHETYKTIEKMT